MADLFADVHKLWTTKAAFPTLSPGAKYQTQAYDDTLKLLMMKDDSTDTIAAEWSADVHQVLLAGAQTISGAKTFSADLVCEADLEVQGVLDVDGINSDGGAFAFNTTGAINTYSSNEGAQIKCYGSDANGIRTTIYTHDANGYSSIYGYDEDGGVSPGYVPLRLGHEIQDYIYIAVGGSVKMSSLTASRAVFTDGTKNLVSNAITGTGNVVMSTKPTISSVFIPDDEKIQFGNVLDTEDSFVRWDTTLGGGNGALHFYVSGNTSGDVMVLETSHTSGNILMKPGGVETVTFDDSFTRIETDLDVDGDIILGSNTIGYASDEGLSFANGGAASFSNNITVTGSLIINDSTKSIYEGGSLDEAIIIKNTSVNSVVNIKSSLVAFGKSSTGDALSYFFAEPGIFVWKADDESTQIMTLDTDDLTVNVPVHLSNTLYITESSSAEDDIPAMGQLWIKDDTPNTLMFTDDAGTDQVVSQVSGSFTCGVTGLTTSPTDTAYYTINGNVVTLRLPPFAGTSNATTFTLTGLPAAIQSSIGTSFVVAVQDNGTYSWGKITISSTSSINITLNAVSGWTASGTKSIGGSGQYTVTYALAIV